MIDVVDIALSQEGVFEGPGNTGLPLERYGLPRETALPWCARGVRWCFVQWGHRLPGNPYEIGNVATMRDELRAAGALLPAGARPVRGDIGFVKGTGGSDVKRKTGNHVFLVVRVVGDFIHTVEFNLSDSVKQSVRRFSDEDLWDFARWPLPAEA